MIEVRKLSQGIKIVMDPVSEVESVAIGLWVRTGAVDEVDKYAGISHFVEHMMFKGTETRTAMDIAADIDKIGGQINAFTGKEATCYHVKVLSSNFIAGVDVLLDMIENSVYDKVEMSRERRVIEEEIKMTLDSPEDLAHDVSTELIFKGQTLGNSIIGTATNLKRISRNVMTSYVKNRYTKDNIVISVAGKFDADEICRYFQNRLEKLEEKSVVVSEPKDAKEYKPGFRVIKKDIDQTHICLGVPTIALDDESYYGLMVLNNAVGGTMSSRLFQNIRETKGLAYSVFSMATSFRESGYFKIYAGVAGDKVKAAIDGIKEELDKVAEKSISSDELHWSGEQLKASFIFGQENMAARMFTNGKNLLLMDKVQTMEDIIEAYDNVSMDEINRIKDLVCDFSRYSAVAVTGNANLNIKKYMRG
ncbi:MAG: pitrilysin family protein [Peptostreptococcaceae bacterium]|nr:pitrilysin family protein [Peptostreptococcaceae bacterium]MDY5739016.1 pitrilysin family protein [Anaerovoracaceae bacterium]